MKRTRSITWSIRALSVAFDPDGTSTLRCMACGSALDLHQPDATQPDRLLGTCSGDHGPCGCWHMIDLTPDQKQANLHLMPNAGATRSPLRPTVRVLKGHPGTSLGIG